MRVAGTIIVVTGGGNGIGQQVVLELLRRGARVAAVDIRPDGLEETAALARADDQLATFVVDITDRDAVEALAAQVVERFGTVDGVVNVAGIIQPFVPLAELGRAAIDRVLDVNVWGTIHVVQAFLPHLLARPVAHVVTFSSMGGFVPVPGQTIYGASKAAVKLLTEGLYAELRQTNVGVSVVLPGAVRTDIVTNSGAEAPTAADNESRLPITEADAAARIVVDGIQKDRLYIHVGTDSRVLHLLHRLLPKRTIHLVERQMRRGQEPG